MRKSDPKYPVSGKRFLNDRALDALPEFDRELVRDALLKWIKELAVDPSASPDLQDVPAFSSLSAAEFASLRKRNLRVGGKNGYGIVATACCVGVEAIQNLLIGNSKRRTYSITLRKICLSLVHRGLLAPVKQSSASAYMQAPLFRVGRDLVEQAQLLAIRAAAADDQKSAGSVQDRAKFSAECDALAREAIRAERADLADAVCIAKAGAYLKAGCEICKDTNSWRVREDLSRIRQTTTNQAIRDAAALTEYKMLRELMPTVPDAGVRLLYFKKAAELLKLLEGESDLPIALMLPGLPNEVSQGARGVDWGDVTRYPISFVVRRPFRYQAASLVEAAVEQWLLDPAGKDPIELMLKKAASNAGVGAARIHQSAAPRINIASTGAHIRLTHAMMSSLSGGHQLAGRTLSDVIAPFEVLLSDVATNRELSDYDRLKYEALFILAQAWLNVRSRERFTAVVLDQVLPRLAASTRLRPGTRTILTQEASIRMALWQYPDLWDCFLRASGFSEEEIHMPSISAEMRMPHALQRSRRSRGPL